MTSYILRVITAGEAVAARTHAVQILWGRNYI